MNANRPSNDGQSRRLRRRAVGTLTVFLILCLQCGTTYAVDFKNIVWGFDGRVVSKRFNLLSIELHNNSAQAFEGRVRLRKAMGSRRPGAELIEPVYIAPFSQKRVQFHPYMIDDTVSVDSDAWSLTAVQEGGRAKRMMLKHPKFAEPARVILVAADDSFVSGGGGIRRFREDLFPPMVTATDGLAAVVLDHAPRWEKVRAQAFLDWLHRGGTVHICYSAEQKYPRFPDSLAVLNTMTVKSRIGAGAVIRHPRALSAFDAAFAKQTVLKPPQATKTTSEPSDEDDSDLYDHYGDWNHAEGYFHRLKQMTMPDHNWGVIHLMSLAYILLIFPGCYLLFRRRANYKITYSILMGLVLVFSFGFRAIGRRGYGESTAVNTVAIARPLGDGHYDVTQWTNVFVIDGAEYSIAHRGTGRLYSTAQEFETVDGTIDNGLDGAFTVDIPPYSNRSFVHRQKVKGKPIRLSVEKWEAGGRLRQLTLTTGDSLPETTGEIYALFKDQLYELSNTAGHLKLKYGGQDLSQGLRMDQFGRQYYGFYEREFGEHVSVSALFSQMRDALITANLGVSNKKELGQVALPDDRVRIFLYAKATDEFFAAGDSLGKQAGYVLYCIDVFKPEKP